MSKSKDSIVLSKKSKQDYSKYEWFKKGNIDGSKIN